MNESVCLVVLQASACAGNPIIFLLPASDRLLIWERNVSYLGLHTSEHKNIMSCVVSGGEGGGG